MEIQKLEAIKSEICDHYCKYPIDPEYEEIDDICESCPLNVIIERADRKE